MFVKEIGGIFGVNKSAIGYWIYPRMRKSVINRATREFARRYRSEEDFRRRHIRAVRKYQKKKEAVKRRCEYNRSPETRKYHVDYGRRWRKNKKTRGR